MAMAKTYKAYRVTRNVTKDECDWLDDDVPEGTIVFKYEGVTYGCIGPRGLAVSMDGGEPFFELPRTALEEVDEQETS